MKYWISDTKFGDIRFIQVSLIHCIPVTLVCTGFSRVQTVLHHLFEIV
jgi:hypothetical protein